MKNKLCVFFSPPHKVVHATHSAFPVIFPFATYCNRIHGNRTAEIDCAALTHLAEREIYFNAKEELINLLAAGESEVSWVKFSRTKERCLYNCSPARMV